MRLISQGAALACLLALSSSVTAQTIVPREHAERPRSLAYQHGVMRAIGYQTPGESQVSVDPFVDDDSPAPVVGSAVQLAGGTADCQTCVTDAAPALAPVYNSPMTYSAPACGTCPTECNSCSGCTGSCGGGCGSAHCDCNLGDAFTLSGLLHGDCEPSVTVGGWFSAGYHSKGNDLFNSRPDEVALHQAWLYAEKLATSDSPLGFRVDLMYGIDADDTQAFGNPSGTWDFENGWDYGAYGWALPQLYGELAVGDWNIKAGHFYTLIGYEVVTAPDNFFYSHAMTMYNSEPFTHTGVLASRPIGENFEIYAGWTLGWDTGFAQFDQGNSWLGGFGYTINENASFTYMSTAGNFGARGREAYSHSLVLDLTLTDRLNYIIQSDMVRVGSTEEDNIGINQYLIYSLNDCWGIGGRFEWWNADVETGYAPHGGTLPAFGMQSYFAGTVGVNYRPHANLVVRPEVRYDWSDDVDYDETYFGIDAVVTF